MESYTSIEDICNYIADKGVVDEVYADEFMDDASDFSAMLTVNSTNNALPGGVTELEIAIFVRAATKREAERAAMHLQEKLIQVKNEEIAMINVNFIRARNQLTEFVMTDQNKRQYFRNDYRFSISTNYK